MENKKRNGLNVFQLNIFIYASLIFIFHTFFIYWFIHPLIHPVNHLCIRLFNHSFIQSIDNSLIRLFVHSLIGIVEIYIGLI